MHTGCQIDELGDYSLPTHLHGDCFVGFFLGFLGRGSLVPTPLSAGFWKSPRLLGSWVSLFFLPGRDFLRNVYLLQPPHLLFVVHGILPNSIPSLCLPVNHVHIFLLGSIWWGKIESHGPFVSLIGFLVIRVFSLVAGIGNPVVSLHWVTWSLAWEPVASLLEFVFLLGTLDPMFLVLDLVFVLGIVFLVADQGC
jgi:hypothetical protein